MGHWRRIGSLAAHEVALHPGTFAGNSGGLHRIDPNGDTGQHLRIVSRTMAPYPFAMADPSHPEPSPEQVASERFYSGALDRIYRFMIAIAPLAAGVVFWKFGTRRAIGFVLGCLIAFVNFFWLKRAISGFAERATGVASSESGTGIVARFLLRYALIAIGAYAILSVSPASLNGLLAGLFLPVVAIGCEAAYEVYAALRRGV